MAASLLAPFFAPRKIPPPMPSLKQVVEALIFASQKPLLPNEIVVAIKLAAHDSDDDSDALDFAKAAKEAQIAALLEELKIEYIESQRAFQLVEQVNGWTITTDPNCARWVRQLFPESKPVRLSGPALETLAIISYRQPITRADIEAVRGVAVDGMVNMLLERGLIRIAGRAEVPGRPLLYETTQFFLEHFGLKNLDELPNVAELRRMNLPTAPSSPPPATASSPEQTTEPTILEIPASAEPETPSVAAETPASGEAASGVEEVDVLPKADALQEESEPQ
jgi:segregation and condensation protein B